jgi:hypothetical protein
MRTPTYTWIATDEPDEPARHPGLQHPDVERIADPAMQGRERRLDRLDAAHARPRKAANSA